MKAEIDEDGTLIIMANKGVESFALNEWYKKNINPCTGGFICDKPYNAMLVLPFQKKPITLFHRIWLKIQSFLYR